MASRAHRFTSAGIERSVLCAATIVLCTGVLGACGSSSGSSTATGATKANLDVARVERSIEHSIMSQRHLQSKVVCPARIVQQPGKFPCIATTVARGKPRKAIKTPFVVTIHNGGYVTYVGK
jgi:hypothetical protein